MRHDTARCSPVSGRATAFDRRSPRNVPGCGPLVSRPFSDRGEGFLIRDPANAVRPSFRARCTCQRNGGTGALVAVPKLSGETTRDGRCGGKAPDPQSWGQCSEPLLTEELILTTFLEPTEATLDQFVAWLREHRDLPGAPDLFELHSDKIVQRRQGHVKQCFAGVYRFLQEYPDWIDYLATARTNARGLFEPDASLLKDWTAHLRQHRSDENPLYGYQILRNVLRPNLGGVLNKPGGGASGTLKRMFPLVARFVAASQTFQESV